jgi:hypothetical protein
LVSPPPERLVREAADVQLSRSLTRSGLCRSSEPALAQ